MSLWQSLFGAKKPNPDRIGELPSDKSQTVVTSNAAYDVAKQALPDLLDAEAFLRKRLSEAIGKPKPMLTDKVLESWQGSFDEFWLWFVNNQLGDNKPSTIRSGILGNQLNWDGQDAKGDYYFRGWLRQLPDPHDTQRDLHYMTTVQELWIWTRGEDQYEWFVAERRARLST